MTRPDVLAEVDRELDLIESVFGEQDHPNGTGPELQLLDTLARYSSLRNVAQAQTDVRAAAGSVTFADILLEEVFESLAEDDPDKLRAELIQVAAVAAQWIEAIDRKDAGR